MIWFLIVLVSITFILNHLVMKHGLKDISYKRDLSKNIVEIDEEFNIISVLENRKSLPVAYLKITEDIPVDLSNLKITLFAMPYQRVKRTYPVSINKRGHYVFDKIKLEVGDLIGLNTSSKDIDYRQDLIVLPRKLALHENLVTYGNYQGDISVNRWIIDDPLMTIGIREYTGNESERYIHWPSSLRHGNLMVKNFDFTTDSSVNILLNVECFKPFWAGIENNKIETCISLCRGIVEELEMSKIPYSFNNNSFSNNERVKSSGVGPNKYKEVLKSLGKVEYGVMCDFETLIDEIVDSKESFTTFVVVTPRLLKPYIKPLENLRKNNNKLIIISLEEDYLDDLDPSIIKYVRRAI